MSEYIYITLKEKPQIKDRAAEQKCIFADKLCFDRYTS